MTYVVAWLALEGLWFVARSICDSCLDTRSLWSDDALDTTTPYED